MDPISSQNDAISCKVLSNGEVLDLKIGGVTLSREIGKIPLARIEIIDGNPAEGGFEQSNLAALQPGSEIEIQLGALEQEEGLFQGVVTRQRVMARGHGSFRLEVECRDAAYRMTLDKQMRFHHTKVNDPSQEPRDADTVADVTDDAVLKELVEKSGYGLEFKNDAPLDQTSQGNFRHENLLQYQSSDWDFLLMRAEATGRLCTVEDGTIRLLSPQLDQALVSTLELGVDLLEFEAEFDGTVGHTEFEASSWDIDQLEVQREPGKTSTVLSPGELDAKALADTAGWENRQLHHGGDLKGEEAQRWALNQANRLALAQVRGTGRISGTVAFLPGQIVELKGLGRHWNGRALVSGVRHEYRSGHWITHLQFGLDATCHAEKYPVHASPSANLLPGIPGLHYGIVKGNVKSPGGYELVEVELSGPEAGDDVQTVYARHAHLFAGAKGTTHFRPEEGDEVVLGFIQQDPRFPVILGSMFNSQTTAEWPLEEGKQNLRGLFLKGEQEKEWKVQIDEEENTLVISTAKHTFTLDEKNQSIEMADAHDNTIVMDQNGITLKSANGSIVMEAGKEIESKVGSSSSKIDQKSLGMKGIRIEMNADTMAEIKGATLDLN